MPNFTVSSPSIVEGNAGTTTLVFTVSRTDTTPTETVYYRTINTGSAAVGSDYAAAMSSLTFAAGDAASQTFTVTINGDLTPEATETFGVQLFSDAGYATLLTTGTGTITNDDAPLLTINDPVVSEGSGGTTVLTYTVSLSAPAGPGGVTFDIATADGTATSADSDYAVRTLTGQTIAAGASTYSFSVTVNGDTRLEPSETVLVNVTNVTGATVSDGQGQGTITNDDLTPTIGISSVTQAEGNAGTTNFTFNVTLSAASGTTTTVDYATADAGASSGTDYTATSGTLTFAPGETVKTVVVSVNGDTVFEATQNFVVNLSNASNATLTGGQGTGTITNDDAAPVITITPSTVTQAEGTPPGSTTTPYVFTVTSTGASELAASVNYAFAGSGGAPANAADFSGGSLPSGTLTFGPTLAASTNQFVTATVAADSAVEQDETFTVTLSGVTNATLGSSGASGTITNDDISGAISINSVSLTEGGANSTATLTITRGGGVDPNVPFSVDYTTVNGSALAGSDFVATSGTVFFAAGQTTATVPITIVGDALLEADESFSVVLSNSTNGVPIGTATGVITIVNDDVAGPPGPNDPNAPVTSGNTTFVSANYVMPADSTATVVSTRDNAGTNPISIVGNANTQTIIGNYGANALNGGGGADTLVGLLGNDSYVITNSNVVVAENAGEGSDTVQTTVDYVLPTTASVEFLAALDASSVAALNLTGSTSDQQITGNAGANIINGFGGADTMIGLGGNDVFLVRGPGDVVIEGNGGGSDTVFTTVSYNLGVNEVEVLSTVTNSETTAINLIGNFATQTIVGNFGNNVLNGGSGGLDTLIGLLGDDIYAVGDSQVDVIEQSGQGNDTVVTSVNYGLDAGVSVEVLAAQDRAGTSSLALFGNELAQTIAGNEGANYLDGGAGADVIIGGGGADIFAFTTALGNGNVDILADFVAGTDRIGLFNAVFSVGGGVTSSNFVAGTAALDGDDRIVYDQATGRLFYDADGSGAGAATLFAIVGVSTALTAASFDVLVPAMA